MFSVFIQILTNFLFLQIPLLNYYPSHASPLPPRGLAILRNGFEGYQNQRLSDTVWWTGTRDGPVIHSALDKDGFPQSVGTEQYRLL